MLNPVLVFLLLFFLASLESLPFITVSVLSIFFPGILFVMKVLSVPNFSSLFFPKFAKLFSLNGLTKSLNYMMKFTSGDYLARHDADDISHIKRLQYQVNFLKVNKNINILGSNGIYYIKKKKKFIK